jgi:hypothetical protein
MELVPTTETNGQPAKNMGRNMLCKQIKIVVFNIRGETLEDNLNHPHFEVGCLMWHQTGHCSLRLRGKAHLENLIEPNWPVGDSLTLDFN